MCGIAGFINFKDPVSTAQMANRVQQHRGTMASTTGCTTMYAVHQRLSIIDLDKRSDQPFTKGNLTIIFNGKYIIIRY